MHILGHWLAELHNLCFSGSHNLNGSAYYGTFTCHGHLGKGADVLQPWWTSTYWCKIFVIFRNNLNGFLDFYHGTNVDAGEPKASYLFGSRGCWLGLRLFEATRCGCYWFLNHFLNEKLNKIETENCIGIWEHFSWCCWKALWWVKFSRVYFTIFRAKVWKILSFEWILLLEIQLNWKNWVWKGKAVELSMCSHCQIAKFLILKNNVKKKECVHTWAKGIGYTSHQLVLSSNLL
jgi:hypothetical protein